MLAPNSILELPVPPLPRIVPESAEEMARRKLRMAALDVLKYARTPEKRSNTSVPAELATYFEVPTEPAARAALRKQAKAIVDRWTQNDPSMPEIPPELLQEEPPVRDLKAEEDEEAKANADSGPVDDGSDAPGEAGRRFPGDRNAQKFYQGNISKAEADSLLLAIGAEGTFLTREKAHGKEDEVVLSVIFTGKATHHLVNRDSETGTMMINGRETPAKTLGELQTLLRKKQPYWPAPLTTGVEGPDEKLRKASQAEREKQQAELRQQQQQDAAATREQRAKEREARQIELVKERQRREAVRQQKLDELRSKREEIEDSRAAWRQQALDAMCRPLAAILVFVAPEQCMMNHPLVKRLGKLISELENIPPRLDLAFKRDARAAELEEEQRQKLKELFKPARFKRESFSNNPSSPTKTEPVYDMGAGNGKPRVGASPGSNESSPSQQENKQPGAETPTSRPKFTSFKSSTVAPAPEPPTSPSTPQRRQTATKVAERLASLEGEQRRASMIGRSDSLYVAKEIKEARPDSMAKGVKLQTAA